MIGYGYEDRRGRAITLREVDGDNWRSVADLAPRDDQRAFVAPLAARYLLLSTLESDWTSLAIYADDEVVGHAMWGVDDDGSHWIGGVLVDAGAQGAGIGAAAMKTLIEWLRKRPGTPAVRLSYHPTNTAAARLYTTLGFQLTGDVDGDELVAEYRGS